MKTILVVDDDAGLRTVVTRILTAAGYEVSQVASGREALEAVQRTRFDLVITDVYMPDMDGIEFITRVIQLTGHPRLIVMSGGGFADTSQVLEIAAGLGVRWTLAKPFDQPQLLEMVEAALSP